MLGATIERKELAPDGERVLHSVVRVGGQQLFVASEFREWNRAARCPASVGGQRTAYVNVRAASADDVDVLVAKARASGGSADDAADMFWGERFATLVDPVGQACGVAAPIDEARTKAAQAQWDAMKAGMAAAAAQSEGTQE